MNTISKIRQYHHDPDVIKDCDATQKSRLGIGDKDSRAKNNLLMQSMSSKRFDCETSSGASVALASNSHNRRKSGNDEHDARGPTGIERSNNKAGEKLRGKRTDDSALGDNKNFGSAKADTEKAFVPHLAFRLDGKRSKNENSAPPLPPPPAAAAPITKTPRIKTDTGAPTSSSSLSSSPLSDSRSQSVRELRELLLKESSSRTQGNNSRGQSYSVSLFSSSFPSVLLLERLLELLFLFLLVFR